MFKIAISGGLIGGCATSHPPENATPVIPAIVSTIDYYWGTSLSGPLVSPGAQAATTQPGATQPAPALNNSPGAAEALAMDVRLVLLEKMPAEALEPLGTHTRLVVATRGGTPVLSTGHLTRGARFGKGDATALLTTQMSAGQWGKVSEIATLHGALTAGATAVVDVEPSSPKASPVHIEVTRPVASQSAASTQQAPRLTLALAIQDAGGAAADEGAASEKAIVDLNDASAAQRVALVIPANYPGPTVTQALVAIINLSAAGPAAKPDPMRDLAYLAAERDLAKSAARAAQRPTQPSIGTGEASMLTSAIQSLRTSVDARSPLVYLAHQTDAPMCEDLSLVGDAATLTQLQKLVLQQVDATPGAATSSGQIRWILEQSSYSLLAKRTDSGAMPPELASVLALHAGELAQHPDTIGDALNAATDVASLEARLTAENYIYLEDSSPSARARAYDWLAAHGRAPAGYLPLDPPKVRRAALEKALTSPAQPASPTTNPPASEGGAP